MYTGDSDHNPIPDYLLRGLKANTQTSKGNFVCCDSSGASAGLAVENDGTVANQICVGVSYPNEKSDTASIDGAAAVRTNQRFCWGLPASTISNDGFTDADFCKVFYIAGKQTPGKLAVNAGKKRTIGGLVFGLDDFGGQTPKLWPGPLAQLLARSLLALSAVLGGDTTKAVDGSASATTSEVVITRRPVMGRVTQIRFTSLTGSAANASDYGVINVYKADGAGGTHVKLGSYSTQTTGGGGNGAIVAGVPAVFTLSATAADLNLLATDILTYEITKAASGVVIGAGSIEVIQEVI